jgi:hydroxyethylthiazole kinase-like uncharacterized protein yjeF
MKLYTSAQLRQIEKHGLQQGLPLMESAGAAAAKLALEITGDKKAAHFLIFCGSGNNGGDGLVAARLLKAAGHVVGVICPAPTEKTPADARAAHAAYLAAGGQCQTECPPTDEVASYDLIIDAIFGLGLNRAPESPFADWIAAINSARAKKPLGIPVLALDLPSGLQADTGIALDAAVHASHTLAFIGSSLGLHTADGCDLAGQIRVVDLGLDLQGIAHAAQINAPQHFAAALQPRASNSHKGDYGNACIIGGAAGMVGAALLAGRAALHMGAGRVFVGLLAADAPAVDVVQPELMLKNADTALQAASKQAAVAIGPGLGQSAAALACLQAALPCPAPLVLDADALNLLAAHPALLPALQQRAAQGLSTVLTPHEAEAGRLLGCDYSVVHSNRLQAAQQLAHKFQAIIVLKGCGSIVATPWGEIFINPTGSPALATGGTGDVLTGMLCGLLAQSDGTAANTLAATLAAVFVHGQAAQDLGFSRGLAAGELIPAARAALHRFEAP